jgi:hypothetical protein
MEPTETKQVVLKLVALPRATPTPERPGTEWQITPALEPPQGPGRWLYANATLSTGLECSPRCNEPVSKRVQRGEDVSWRWTLGPNEGLRGRHEANVELQWCWKTKPDDNEAPCDVGATAILSRSFDVRVTSGLWDTSVSRIAEAKAVLETLSLVLGPTTVGGILFLAARWLWRKLSGQNPQQVEVS